MKLLNRTLVSLIASLFLIVLISAQLEARRYYIPSKQKKILDINEMEKGPERTEALEELVRKGGAAKYGIELVEELARTYIEEQNVEGLRSILEHLNEGKSTNLELGKEITTFLVEKDGDLKTGVDYLYQIDWWYELSRKKPPAGESSSAWNTETNQEMASLRRFIAHHYHDQLQYDAARATIYQAMLRYPLPEDYQFLGELMMLDREYQAAMGAFMTNYLLSGEKEPVKFFRVAYDSMRWAPAYYDKYFEEFAKLQIEGFAEDCRLNNVQGRARDLEIFPVKDLYQDSQGAVLIFLGHKLSDLEMLSMKKFVAYLDDHNIPRRFISLGLHTEGLESQIISNNLGFTVPYHGDDLVDHYYELDALPTIQAIDSKGHYLFRLTEAYDSMDRTFDLLWKEYLHDRGLTAYSE